MITKTASAQLNHLSYFALMAERFDTTAPTTNAVLSGEEGKDGWFKSDVEVTLNAQDNEGGLGVDYTLYKVNEGDWQEYTSFLNFTDEGDYLIEFYSVDNDENIEDVKSVEFHIDKTPPEAKFQFNLDTLEAEILGLDANATEILTEKDKGKQRQVLTIRDKAGNTLRLIGKFKLGKTAMFSIKSLSYNENDVVEFDKNLFHTHYSQDKKIGDLKSLFQNWFDKKNVFLRIVYKAKDNQSVIFTKKLGHKVQKETRQGFIILSVQTDDGNLVYGYE
ncbi:hypothetical protein KKB40_03900 [Patescibacteria group bacterium]|nr:hypothetical protein [Patescibacteria group bacterium]